MVAVPPATLLPAEDGDGRGQVNSMLMVRAHKRSARSHGQYLIGLWGERGKAF